VGSGCSGPDDEPTSVAEKITQQLAAGETVHLAPGGTYLLSSPIFLTAGARLLGDPLDPPTLRPAPDFAAPSADVDDPRNALVYGEGNVRFATVATSTARKDESSISVDDASGIGAGVWVRIAGTNWGGDIAGSVDGANVIKREVARVASIDGNTITFVGPLLQQHGAGSTVEVIDALTDVVVRDIVLDGTGAAVACGLTLADSIRAELSVSVRGFARAGLDLVGSSEAQIECEGLGGCNAVLFLDSVSSSEASVRSRSGVDRTHPLGYPRGIVTLRHRCSGVTIKDSVLEGGCTGVSVWGGTNVTLRDVAIRDMRLHERAARDPFIVHDYGQARCAAGIEANGFYSPSPDGEFGYGLTIRNVSIENCRHPDPLLDASVLLVDEKNFSVSGLSIANSGEYASTDQEFMGGFTLYDVLGGLIDGLTLHGVVRPLVFAGAWVQVDISSVEITLADAVGDNYTPLITLACANPPTQPSRIRVDRFIATSTSTVLDTTERFEPRTAEAFSIAQMSLDMHDFDDVIVGTNGTGEPFAQGQVAEISPGSDGQLALVTPTMLDAAGKVAIVNGSGLGYNSGTGWLLCSRGPRRSLLVRQDDSVSPGKGIAVSVGERTARVASATDSLLGIAVTSRPAGASGLVALT
jgi:hypothetical protein